MKAEPIPYTTPVKPEILRMQPLEKRQGTMIPFGYMTTNGLMLRAPNGREQRPDISLVSFYIFLFLPMRYLGTLPWRKEVLMRTVGDRI